MWDVKISGRYVAHNTMLEGYGTTHTKELIADSANISQGSIDPLTTPHSVYFFAKVTR